MMKRNTVKKISELEEGRSKLANDIEQLKMIKDTETYILDIDCDHIYQFSQQLYKQIECYPADVIPIFDLVVT